MGASFEDVNAEGSFPLVIVGGLSGAGKSTAIDVFEDLRFFVVDGLPASIVPKLTALFSGQNQLQFRGLVVGMYFRDRTFPQSWLEALEELKLQGLKPQIIFMEARNEVLVRRYSSTRRPHPVAQLMAMDGKEGDECGPLSLDGAINLERERLYPIKKMADIVIDTSDYSVHDLRKMIQRKWTALEEGEGRLNIQIISFGFKYGPPAEADLIFDMRFLPNPYFVQSMRPLTGKDEAVAEYVLGVEPGKTFLVKLREFLEYLFPLYEAEGRYRVTLGIGCTGGRHRSVAVSEALYKSLKESNYVVSIEHRHVELG
ncbi:RNase adapter RapZ [Oceanidesulfovibrio marinus]|uniref:RNase adapter RapZ n=1 Tax=Oceanidesulfovibrio marinus TaxID=370038 RepID=A0ABX6NBR5_9BACT|nr:RNase adapter RapZ [Oceanidesulfovibrio marinus]QJT08032.1 RNase adapter RapZ [Oceanidesulfovibrio marinus]